VSRGKERRRPVHVLRAGWRLAPLAVVPAVAAGLLAVRIDRAAPARGASVASAASEGLPATGAREGAPFGTRLAHIDLTIELEPQAHTMGARGTYDVENSGASTLQSLRFHVPAVLGEVIWEGGAERSTGRRVRDTVEVALTAPLRPGDRVRVGFRYRATMPARYTRNGGGASSYILPEATVLSTHRGAFLPALVGAERDARGFTSRMTVSAPRQYTVNGVGDLVAQKTVGNRSTVTWATEHPVVALSLMAGRWNVARAPGGRRLSPGGARVQGA
jgi:ABC-2 type transport system permease protein